MPKKNLKNRDLDKAAVAWMNLGFYLAQLDSEMRQLLGDGRTSKERSIDALRVQLGRKKAGKITGDHQAAAAKSTRAQICALASAVRNDDPRITDEKLVEEVRARIKRKLTSATIHEHIRALKRSGQLPARSRN